MSSHIPSCKRILRRSLYFAKSSDFNNESRLLKWKKWYLFQLDPQKIFPTIFYQKCHNISFTLITTKMTDFMTEIVIVSNIYFIIYIIYFLLLLFNWVLLQAVLNCHFKSWVCKKKGR